MFQEFVPGIDGLQKLLMATCMKEGQTERKVLERLLYAQGYLQPRLKRRQLKVKLTEELKNFLKQKEEDIANQFKTRAHPVSMDYTIARYIIRTALENYDSYETGRSFKKKEIDQFLGYCSRTMRLQQQMTENSISNPSGNSKERKIFWELCSDLEQFVI